jgi:hypothetical protein
MNVHLDYAGIFLIVPGLLPKRTASLARFLHKRKQRQEHTTQPCPASFVSFNLTSIVYKLKFENFCSLALLKTNRN